MFAKILFLLSASALFAFNLRTTPEELQAYIEQVDEIIKGTEHEAQIELRSFQIPLGFYTDNAKGYIIGNLTEAAKLYWDAIASLQKQAAETGQDISSCVELGNKQLYKLNITTVNPLISKIQSYYDQGDATIVKSSDDVYKVFDKLFDFEAKSKECSDNDCADTLKTEAMILFQTLMDSMADSISVAREFVIDNLEGNLDEIKIDSAAYVKSYGVYLDDVKGCINAL